MFTCSTLLLFPYPVPADFHGSVQQVTLRKVPVDVLSRLFLWFSQAKHFECRYILPPQEVQCVHMYSPIAIAMYVCMYVCMHVCTVPDTSYLRGSDVYRSLPTQVSMKVRKDICSVTAPLPRTTRVESGGFATGLCIYVRTYYTIL